MTVDNWKSFKEWVQSNIGCQEYERNDPLSRIKMFLPSSKGEIVVLKNKTVIIENDKTFSRLNKFRSYTMIKKLLEDMFDLNKDSSVPLKECPFCGEKDFDLTNEDGMHVLLCKECFAKMEGSDTEQLFKKWNRRWK